MIPPMMAYDDVSNFVREAGGLYVFLGTQNASSATTPASSGECRRHCRVSSDAGVGRLVSRASRRSGGDQGLEGCVPQGAGESSSTVVSDVYL